MIQTDRWLICLFIVCSLNSLFAQNKITVNGTVVDETNLPMIGVNISVENTTIGTVTNLDGEFTLDVEEGTPLLFSYIGYNNLKAEAQPKMQIRMEVNAVMLDAVTVVGVGYGTMRKSDLTGAIASVSVDDMKQGMITSSEQLLQGKVAGLTVVQASGDPSQGASLRLRGGTSLSASNSPLIVVDGIPGVDLNTIQPGDILSMDVLKDASATAIYGSRGANGVIIVTTNRENATRQISYNGYLSVGNASKNMDLLSADQWREYVRKNELGGASDYGGNTDWQDELQRTAISQNHTIAFTGGNQYSGLRASFSYLDAQGVIKTSEMKRLSASATGYLYGLNDHLKLEAGLHFTSDKWNPIDMGIYERAYNLNPTLPVKNEDGSYTQIGGTNNNNPVELLMNRADDSSRKRLLAYGKAELEIIDGLKGVANASYEYNSQQGRYYRPSYAFTEPQNHGFGTRSLGDYTNMQFEGYLNYNKEFNKKHRMDLMAGYSYLNNMYEGFNASRRNFSTDDFLYNNLSSGSDYRVGDVGSYKGEATLISFFGRANYVFNDRYMFTGTLRYDGSSRFGDNNKWGLFPSASAAWRISEEAFMDGTKEWLDNMKLRVGYGVTGNQDGIGEYRSLSLIGPGENYFNGTEWVPTYGPSQNPNADLKWESTAQFNVGLDMTLLQRFNVTIEVYSKKTSDLLYTYAVPMPPYLYQTMMANVGDLSNKGVELTIGANILKTNDFTWDANLTLAHNKQVVDRLSNEIYQTEAVSQGDLWGLTGMSGTMTQTLREGYPVGTFWGPKFVELDENGKFVFETDAQGNVINQELGHAQPKLSMGFAMDFKYRRFDLNIATYGMFGQKILNAQKMNMSYPGRMPAYNILDSYIDAKESEGPVFSDYWIEKGDFLRIQNITLGYTVPVKNDWFSKIRVYATAENPFVITGYSGLDPEVSISGLASPGIDKSISSDYYYPHTRNFIFGVNLVF